MLDRPGQQTLDAHGVVACSSSRRVKLPARGANGRPRLTHGSPIPSRLFQNPMDTSFLSRSMATNNADTLAVLIDADNAQAAIVTELLAEVSQYGTAIIKRAYGDWTTPNLRGWKEVLLSYAIEPKQQFSYTTGKNATDSALIIDAMDLLHSRSLGGFCIVSSDSDYTRLAARIRESGASVYGFGERKTPQPFVAACNKFVYTEVLRSPNAEPPTRENHEPALEPLLRASITAAARDSGWSALATVGSLLNKNDPSFDPRNFGFQKLGELVRAQRYVEVKETLIGDGSTNVHLHVRLCEA